MYHNYLFKENHGISIFTGNYGITEEKTQSSNETAKYDLTKIQICFS
jgi:hypothetical protein